MDRTTSRSIAVRDAIELTLQEIGPYAHQLRCEAELDCARRILTDGNGADDPLAVHRKTGDAAAVTRRIVAASRPG